MCDVDGPSGTWSTLEAEASSASEETSSTPASEYWDDLKEVLQKIMTPNILL
jgi:hypothetical protein